MESNTRSPIFSYFSELLEGIVTVRAFSAERRFLDNLHRKIDTTTKVWLKLSDASVLSKMSKLQMWYTFWMTNRWLLLNFDMLGSLSILITTLFSIATLIDEAGLAGLCITSAMGFTSSVYWACRFWTGRTKEKNRPLTLLTTFVALELDLKCGYLFITCVVTDSSPQVLSSALLNSTSAHVEFDEFLPFEVLIYHRNRQWSLSPTESLLIGHRYRIVMR
jgi:hypothetical protein